jgi:transposase, IS30 family
MRYAHLTREQRYQISCLHREAMSKSAIAERIGCHRSTVYRELSRNRTEKGYQAAPADQLARRRRSKASSLPRIPAERWAQVDVLLIEDWSPEQIRGRWRLEGKPLISAERIYQHIAADRRRGGDLWTHRRHPKPYRRSRLRPGRYSKARSIHERPARVATRAEPGHWEGDSMRGSQHSAGIATWIERSTRMVRIAPLPDASADAMMRATLTLLGSLGPLVKTITMDRGTEFAEYQLMEIALDAKAYFADPYCAWQRGSNENINGLLRQYLPRDRDFRTITAAEAQRIEDKLNNRPRKVLGYRTPNECAMRYCDRLNTARAKRHRART